MSNEKLTGIILKYLRRRPLKVRSVTYDFKNVTWNINHYVITVDAILPSPKWCFYVTDLKTPITEAISNVSSNVLGKHIAFRVNLTINGKSLYPEVFINKEKQDQILKGVNQYFSILTFGDLSVNLLYSYGEFRYGQRGDGDGIDFDFDAKLYNLKFLGKPAKIKPEYFESVFTKLYLVFLETKAINLDIADFCYSVIEDQNILDTDSFVGTNINFISLDGKKFGSYIEGNEVNDESIKFMIDLKNGSKS